MYVELKSEEEIVDCLRDEDADLWSAGPITRACYHCHVIAIHSIQVKIDPHISTITNFSGLS